MTKALAETSRTIIEVLNQAERDEIGQAWLSGETLQERTRLSPAEINDATMLLVERGSVAWRR